jgi:hypothetical protein
VRRWGYWVGGLAALAIIAGALDPDQSEPQDLPVATQSQTATPTQEPELDQSTQTLTEESATSEPSSEPSPSPTQTQVESAEPVEVEQTQSASPSPTPTQAVTVPSAPATGFAALLAQLVIEEEFPSGYDRDLFSHWIDADRDGCNTRREVLIIEAVDPPTIGDRCELIGGLWYSAFDGVTTDDDSSFDIDHMVALKEAWDSGAHAWDSDRRRAFANDLDLPEALIAVSSSSNRSKGADDPAEWLPPLRSYHCQYVNDWMVVKIKWELSVDAREFSALRTVASNC